MEDRATISLLRYRLFLRHIGKQSSNLVRDEYKIDHMLRLVY
jgi:hypothetical protein